MDILYLLDRLEWVLNKGRRIPFTSNAIIREDECLKLIDQMRVSIPAEIERAKRIDQERDQIIAQAQEEAGRLVTLAEEQAVDALDEHEVLKEAQAQAEAIVEDAQREAEAFKLESEEYVMEVLSDLEDRLKELLSTVHNGIMALQEELGDKGMDQEGGEQVGSTTQDKGIEGSA